MSFWPADWPALSWWALLMGALAASLFGAALRLIWPIRQASLGYTPAELRRRAWRASGIGCASVLVLGYGVAVFVAQWQLEQSAMLQNPAVLRLQADPTRLDPSSRSFLVTEPNGCVVRYYLRREGDVASAPLSPRRQLESQLRLGSQGSACVPAPLGLYPAEE